MNRIQDFERVALPHLDAAYSLANWLVRNSSDAEDVVQDAYLRAFKAFDQFAGGDIRPWLLTIVRNVAYRWLSVRKRTANVISFEDAYSARDDKPGYTLEPASPDPSAEEVLLGRAEHSLVRRALEALPPAFREVIVLRDLEGLSYRHIAEVTDAPIGTVMSRLARARDRLKEQLAQIRAKEDQDAL